MAGVTVGVAHPDVLKLAKAIQDAGWRVTSIWRPEGTHSTGLSLDASPMRTNIGGFGLRTARHFLGFAHRALPGSHWLVLSEHNHLHIQRTNRDVLGTQAQGETAVLYDPNTFQRLEKLTMNDLYKNLPSDPIGDVSFEQGDADISFSDSVALEMGDADLAGEVGDYEDGGPRTFRGKIVPSALIAKIAKAGRINPQQRSLLAKLQRSNPRAARLIPAMAKARQAATMDWAQFEYAEGCKIVASSLGRGKLIKDYQLTALKNAVMAFPAVEPAVLPFTVVGSTATLALDAALVSALGIPAASAAFPFAGIKLMITASELNKTKGAQITIEREFGGLFTLKTTVALSHTQYPNISFVNGRIIAGEPRFAAPLITPVAVASGNWDIVITGLPTGYLPTARLLMPGDVEAERFLRLV